MSEFITNVSDASFEQDVLQADGPVLVDYWAEWCGPCKMIAPVLDEIGTPGVLACRPALHQAVEWPNAAKRTDSFRQ